VHSPKRHKPTASQTFKMVKRTLMMVLVVLLLLAGILPGLLVLL